MSGVGREVPEHLVNEILAGRCVAFVGAGFSSNVPRWSGLLDELARGVGGEVEAQVKALIAGKTAFDYEAAGQLIRDAFVAQPGGDLEFERAVHAAIQRRIDALATEKRGEQMKRRLRWLREIPFAAILTTNYDQNLEGWRPSNAFSRVLRHRGAWWEHESFDATGVSERPHAVKLHGDANLAPDDNPIVLAKRDYRRLLYEDARYANFLRAVFATRTVLFLGVSFTDAYLNELRSEIFSLLGPELNERQPALGYAVLEDRSPEVRRYFREHEGIELLNFTSCDDFVGFDEWLEAIHAATAPVHRLQQFLHGQHIVWVDPSRENNEFGIHRLETDVGAQVDHLESAEALDEDRHAKARLLITNFGYRADGASAFDVLERVNRWGHRPPVVVFADSKHAHVNRLPVISRGAYEYASSWSELFELIERLFGRLG